MVVIGNTQERQSIPEQIDGCHSILNHRPREGDQEPIFHHTSHVHGQRGSLPNKQKHGEIQRESAERIRPENGEIQMETGRIPQQGVLHDHPRNAQEREATRRDVVKRSNGVQANTLGIKQNLNQNQPGGLKSHGQELQHNPPGIEFGLAVSRDRHPDRDRDHVEHGLGLESVLLEENPNGVDGDGHEGLEHLNKRHREVNVSGIGEPEREGVEKTDRDDGLEVELAGHGNGLDELEDPDEEVGYGGAEGHVDHGEGDGEWPIVHLTVEDVLVVDDDGEAEEDPDRDIGVGEEDLLHHALR
ncbi:hypothetical protein TorRG33x02_152150 [Trema orientale]|uniref:Uncharacterized protein n=1 Tax=Trema orientale TaxID=63057 RepID=A0A2P5ETY9_TREOI|nr:hypothetical protein TorRG33x02_152150 [Trema orientale]